MEQIKFAGIPYLHLDVYQGHDHVFNIQVEDDSTKEIIRYIEGTITCKVRRNSPSRRCRTFFILHLILIQTASTY